jgi:glycerol-3-phosphate dehydrogenase
VDGGGSAAGGDLPGDFASFLADVGRRWPFLPAEVAGRMAHAYGTRITRILGDAASLADLGQDFGQGFYEAELRYLMDHEWARTSRDVLWRRSKLGLTAPPEMVARIDQWFEKNNR